jgi:hypothetical protein
MMIYSWLNVPSGRDQVHPPSNPVFDDNLTPSSVFTLNKLQQHQQFSPSFNKRKGYRANEESFASEHLLRKTCALTASAPCGTPKAPKVLDRKRPLNRR